MGKDREIIKMRMLMLMVVVIMLIKLSIKPSLAQQDEACLPGISNCLVNVGSPTDLLGCCSIIQDDIDNQRSCFCLMSDTVQQNDTLNSNWNTIFSFCGITDTFATLCPASDNSSSTPEASPPSPTPTLTPADTPSSPSPAGSGVCWDRIANCTSDASTSSDLLQCCPLLKDEISKERDCFCAAKALLATDPTNLSYLSQFLTFCSAGSFDTLCHGTPSTSPPSDSSPSDTNTPPGPPSSPKTPKGNLFGPTNGNVFGSPLGAKNSGNGTKSNDLKGSSNKISFSVGLLPTSLLIIWAMF